MATGASSAWAAACVGNVTDSAAITLGFETRLAGGELVEALGDDGEVRARDRIIEPHEDIAGLDAVAVLNTSSPTTPPVGCWTFFTFEIDDDRALRDERAGDLGRCRPTAHAAGEQQHDQAAGQKMTMDRVARAARRGRGQHIRSPFFKALADSMNEPRDLHALALPLSGTTLSGRGPGSGRCNTLARTSSLGPNDLDAPLIHHQQPIDACNRAGAMSDHDDDALTLPHAQDRLRQRFLAVGVEI